MAFVGEAFLSASLQVALDKLATPMLREFGSRLGADKDLKKLTRMLSKIQAVIDDAEQRQISDKAVEMWLSDLKQVAFDAEDLLDEVATEAMKFNFNNLENNQVLQNFISSSKDYFSKLGLAPKIKEITKRVQEISYERDQLSLKEGVGKKWSEIRERPQTTSLVDESCVFGRTDDVKKIVELLIGQQVDNNNNNNNNISVIPIVGMGGLGKTTLAQLVYNDEKVMGHFELRIWVCVSDDSDVRRITKSIIEAAKEKPCDVEDLQPRQSCLQGILEGKRFLLVLDDVWNEDRNYWDLLRLPFRVGATVSRIIVTTRSIKVSSVMGTIAVPYKLEGLSNDDCWSLFKHRAFVDGNSDAHPNLVEIGKKIIKKCKGLPLTAKTFGGLLHSKVNEEDWKLILNSYVRELEENQIIPTLLLSYNHLSSHLRQCFAYCSIFPKDYRFNKEILIQFWVAEGIVQPKRNKTLEDVGREYFDDLLLRSFFQYHKEDKSTFVMHDLIHDLARYVSREICFTVEKDKKCDISEKARYALFTTQRWPSMEVFDKAMNLRTLLFFNPIDEPNSIVQIISKKLRQLRVLHMVYNNDLTELPNSIGNLKHLRHLYISLSRIKSLPESISSLLNLEILNLNGCTMLDELPNSIGNLKHLRELIMIESSIKRLPESISSLHNLEILNLNFCKKLDELPNSIGNLQQLRNLHLSHTPVTRLPESISNLSNLQTLELCSCNDLLELPRDLMNLTSLRHLFLDEYYYLNLLPPGIGRLTNLQTLPPFTVNKKSRDSGIEELKELSNIGGKLWIRGLEDVMCFMEAKEANLEKKHRLKELILEWSSDSNTSVDNSVAADEVDGAKGVLTGLRPHTNIEQLKIRNYQGVKFPSWVGDLSYLYLVSIELSNCEHVNILPPLGQLSALKCLKIEGLHGLEHVGCEFYGIDAAVAADVKAFQSLESLTFSNMRELEEWNTTTTTTTNTTTTGAEDDVDDGGYLCFPCLHELSFTNCPKLQGFPELASLQELCLEGCHELILGSLHSLTSLSSLRISSFQNLSSHSESVLLHPLNALECLHIYGCHPHITLKSEVFMSLKHLKIVYCPEPEYLLKGLQDLSSLETLRIDCCDQLISFPDDQGGLPTSLRSLELCYCGNLEALPMGLQHLTSLEEVKIIYCDSLTSLPKEGLPAQLRHLWIQGSGLLAERCQQGGDDWPKIAHISDLQVDFEQFLI